MVLNSDIYLFALQNAASLKTREKLLLLELFPCIKDIFSLSASELSGLLGRRINAAKWNPDGVLSGAERGWKAIESSRTAFVGYFQPGYPPQLREIYDPPLILFYRGRIPEWHTPFLAIVGTRQPSGESRNAAYRLGMEASLAGIGVVSGLARGIDREAHEGSCEGSGQSIAVLGNGIDTVYPCTSRKTASRILGNGGVIFSEYPPGVPPLPYNFPARNRIISGLSRAVVIIQAPRRSGALITADYALEQGRELYVHPSGLAGAQSEGTKSLYDEGAPLCASARILLREWGMEEKYRMPESDPRFPLDDEKPGRRLAGMLEREIKGELKIYNGQYIRR
ncbi:MAG: DNA-processing protein DprA [Spirochaetales bacterium]|nr:DNA-processing protein DprA [Spirochaetales bacterium]